MRLSPCQCIEQDEQVLKATQVQAACCVFVFGSMVVKKKWKDLDLVMNADIIRPVKANEKKPSVTEAFEIQIPRSTF